MEEDEDARRLDAAELRAKKGPMRAHAKDGGSWPRRARKYQKDPLDCDIDDTTESYLRDIPDLED